MCRDHYGAQTGNAESICMHGEAKSTVSATIIAVNEEVTSSVVIHAQGQPCKSSFKNFSNLTTDFASLELDKTGDLPKFPKIDI